MRSARNHTYNKRSVYKSLEEFYSHEFSTEECKVFAQQKKKKILDYIDLTILIMAYRDMVGELGQDKEIWEEGARGKFHKKRAFDPFRYALVLVDEFQNYLPEQLMVLKVCVSPRTEAMLYIGDMAQRVHLGTITSWSDVGEDIDDARSVRMDKVYRNTKNILRYIGSLGYDVLIPDGLREGRPVVEKVVENKEEEMCVVREIIADKDEGSVGILARSESALTAYRDVFGGCENVYVMTMRESQGLEFECVIIIGDDQEYIAADAQSGLDEELSSAKARIDRDIYYIALTRAMNKLFIIKCG